MKHILPSLLLAGIATAAMSGCKKDEATAPIPVDGLKGYAGKNRAKVEFTVPADARSGKVFYGSGNFVEFTVADPKLLQEVVVENLVEEAQILRVITMNASGEHSDPRGVEVNVYGDKYQETLRPRKWADQVDNSATSIEVVFEPAMINEAGVQVVFYKTSGAKDSVLMPAASTSVTIPDINTDEPYYYYSVYKPEIDAMDAFNSESVDLETALMLDFKKATWTIAESTGDAAGMDGSFLIDNNVNTAWMSSGNTLVQSVTIDMGMPKLMDGFYYVNYQGHAKAAKTLKFELSDDNSTWTTALETQVQDSYLRQRLAIGRQASGRYLRVSVMDAWDVGTAATAQIAEIDAYNNQNTSAENGKDGWSSSTIVPLVNVTKPFKGDGSNPFPTLGAFRMQKLQGWNHNTSAIVSYDDAGKTYSLFTAAVWGLPEVSNGKVYQSVNLQPGVYRLKMMVAHADGPVEAFGVVAAADTLPDISNVKTAAITSRYADLVANQNKTVELVFAVSAARTVNFGIVYNIRSQYSANGTPWSSFNMNGMELAKID